MGFRNKSGKGECLDNIKKTFDKQGIKEKISCQKAFEIAKELGVSPKLVGECADHLGIHIVRCQLGLFGYAPDKKVVQPAEKISSALEKSILSSMEDNRLPCISAWMIAKEFGIPKINVASACEALNIKIKPCQLGAF